eukprot:3031540-Prymnesium_polylepis.1
MIPWGGLRRVRPRTACRVDDPMPLQVSAPAVSARRMRWHSGRHGEGDCPTDTARRTAGQLPHSLTPLDAGDGAPFGEDCSDVAAGSGALPFSSVKACAPAAWCGDG